MTEPETTRWLLLIHQIPPKPGYLRVKIWRQLQRLGAVAIKNSVYALPRSDQAHEDFQWVGRAITDGGGDASICEARFIDGLSDEQVEALFSAARDAGYAQIAEDARRLKEEAAPGEEPPRLDAEVARLRRRFDEVATIDFFGAPGREAADGLLTALEGRARRRDARGTPAEKERRDEFRCRTWVTRKGIHFDRMASAWLIRRFIDARARFKFVPAKGYRPKRGETRFDMFEAEFTHDGDRCTFEVLLDRFGLNDPGLVPLAEIVHDVDLKDSKFGRPETPGIATVVNSIAMAYREDEKRLERGAAVLEDVYEYFRIRQAGREPAAHSGKE